MPTPEELSREVGAKALAGMESDTRSRAEALLLALCRDWVEEAQQSSIPDDVLAILRQDLERDLAGLGPEARLALLEAETLDRELRALGRESYALGCAVIDHAVADDEARRRGERVLDAVKKLAPRVRALPEARRPPLQRQLEEISLEGLYAATRKAMSSRLNQYARERQGASAPTPPKISP